MSPDPSARIAYDILGLPRDADAPSPREAYRKAALRYHPDLADESRRDPAQAEFARINLAYGVLEDSETRRRYDRLLANGQVPDLEREIPEGLPRRELLEILREIDALDLDAVLSEGMLSIMPPG